MLTIADIADNVRLIDLTVGQFKELEKCAYAEAIQQGAYEIEVETVRGIKGIAEALKVVMPIASFLEKSGIFESAIVVKKKRGTVYSSRQLRLCFNRNIHVVKEAYRRIGKTFYKNGF